MSTPSGPDTPRDVGKPGARVAGHDGRLVPAAVAVWVSVLLGLLVGWWLAALLGALTALVGIALVLGGQPQRWWRVGAGLALLTGGLLVIAPTSLRLHTAESDPLRWYADRGVSASLRVELTERPKPVFTVGFGGRRAGVRAVTIPARVREATADGHTVASTGSVLLIAPVDRWSRLLPGQHLDATGTLEPARRGQLTVAVLRVRGPPASVTEAAVWQRVAQELRSGLRESAGVLPAEPAGLLPALVVGDTDTMSRRVIEEFRVAGLSHLVAVSGANLAIVCVAVLLVLRAMRVGPRGSAFGALLALVGFAVLAGPEPSVLRAGVMGAVGLLALAMGKERSALPALGVAVIALVVVQPGMAVSFGFALSVLATAGLVLLAPRWADRLASRGVPRGLAEALAVPAAAHLVTAPVVAGMTGQVSLVAVVANVLAAPVVAPATVLGVLAALVAPVLPWLAELFARLAGPELSWLIMVGRHAADLPGAAIDWPSGWWGGLLLLVLSVLLLVVLRHRRGRVLVCVGLTGLLLVFVPVRVLAPAWPPDGWALVACDVGQGDAAVLATAEQGRAVVVDTGPEPRPVEACLDRLDVERVPLVVLSHLHADHVGGLSGVLAGRAVGAVAVGPARMPEWAWADVQATASAAGVPIVQIAAGRRLTWPGLTIDVLAPRPSAPWALADADGTTVNDASVVLMATTPAGRVLLTGDIELAAQADLLASGANLAADVLKVPHHGSRYTLPDFLAATDASIALISVGADNPYGHPSPSTVRGLTQHGAAVLRTDIDGDSAVLPSDGGGQKAVTRGEPRGPPVYH